MQTIRPRRPARWFALLALFALLTTTLVACTSLELGARPPESIRAVTAAPDVKFIDANGLRFAYLEEGSGPLVLLLHGYPETPHTWAAVQHRLAGAGYRVVAPYLRGYAPSALAPDGDYSIASLAKDTLALIHAFGEQSAIVIGHDWGAPAVYAAATAHPEMIRRLVALSVPHPRGIAGDKSFFLEAPHFVYYQFPWAERLLWSHDFAHIDRVYKRGSPHFSPPPEVIADVKATLRAPGAVEAAVAYYRAVFKTRIADQAKAQLKVTVPSLVIAGRDDAIFKSSRFDKAAAAFTGGYQLVMLDGVGHFPQLEAPDKTADAILAFLGDTR